MKVSELMSSKVTTVEPDVTLDTVRSIFDTTGFHHLLVVEHGRLFGVISDRDLLRHTSPFPGTLNESPRDLATTHRHAHQIMSRHPHTLTQEQSLADVISVFRSYPFSPWRALVVAGPSFLSISFTTSLGSLFPLLVIAGASLFLTKSSTLRLRQPSALN